MLDENLDKKVSKIATETISEKDFLTHFNNQEFELLSKWLVTTALEDISKTDIHPFLRVQAEQACASILMDNRHKNRSYQDFLRGAKLATKVVALAIPNRIEAYYDNSVRDFLEKNK